MKKIFFPVMALVIITATISCNQSSDKTKEQQANDTVATPEDRPRSSPEHGPTPAPSAPAGTAASFSVAPIVKEYLILKNALAADNSKAAADAGRQLLAALKGMDVQPVPAGKHKEYMEIADDAKENAAHIGDAAGNATHQRAHFAALSKDVNNLVVLFGTPQKLYQDHCPMYNDGKGAVWLSETKAIKNPYYGSQMLSCGSVKKEY